MKVGNTLSSSSSSAAAATDNTHVARSSLGIGDEEALPELPVRSVKLIKNADLEG